MSCDFITLVPSLRDSALVCSLPSVTHLRSSGVYSGSPSDSRCKCRSRSHGRLGVSLSVGCGARVFGAKSDPFCALQACTDCSRWQPLKQPCPSDIFASSRLLDFKRNHGLSIDVVFLHETGAGAA